MSLQTIHSATPDTAFSAPQSPLPYFVFCFLSSFLLLFLPSPSPLLLSSCPPGSCSLKWQPQWLILCVMSAAGATWDQPWGQRGLQHRRAGVDVPVECGGGVRAASCGRGRHLLHSCRWSHRGWGGLWRCSGPLTDGFVLEGNKSERKKGDFFFNYTRQHPWHKNQKQTSSYLWVAAATPWWQGLHRTTHTPTP